MSKQLTASEVAEIQHRYRYLINYASDSADEPIDPIRYVDSNGDHMLHVAARSGDVRTVELLIKSGQNIDEKGDMGYTALHYAYAHNRRDVIDLLINYGANKDVLNEFGFRPDYYKN